MEMLHELFGWRKYAFTAVEVGVPKLGNCLEMYTCAQASAQFVHRMCTSLVTPCTLEVYACLGTGLGTCVHFQAVSKLGHSTFTAVFRKLTRRRIYRKKHGKDTSDDTAVPDVCCPLLLADLLVVKGK